MALQPLFIRGWKQLSAYEFKRNIYDRNEEKETER